MSYNDGHRMKIRLRFSQQGKRRSVLTILDQLIVSGSNFATGVILVRGLGLEQFGKFTVAYAVLSLAFGLQVSFISSPMLTIGSLFSTAAAKRSYFRGMLGVELIFCAVVSSIAGLAALAFLLFRPQFADIRLVPAFASGVLLFLLQDWLRRYYFAVGKSRSSIWNDAVSYAGQAVLLACLMYFHRLTLGSALWSIAITSGAAFGLGMAFERIRFTAHEVREAWHRSRVASRDLVVASQLQWFVYQGAMLVGAGVLGAQAAGSVRATQNVVGPVNVAFQAMENIVPIRVGEEMGRGGIQQAAKFLWGFGIRGFLLLLAAFLVLAIFAKSFLSFVYGRQVAEYSNLLNLQLLYFLLLWPLRLFTYLFRTIGKTSYILRASLTAAITSLILVYPLAHIFEARGIMLAADAGQLGNLIFMTVAWMNLKSSYSKEEHLQAMPK